ncbi:MAG: sigmaK-factor processing regulatory BofA [Clostridiaceae bacterium]|nr:sigmaK-factor processing regulatory BofA [Clostridiaceae bacterium]
MKLTGNAIMGAIVLILLNLIGTYFNFHININLLSTLITGLLGIPGVILLFTLNLF